VHKSVLDPDRAAPPRSSRLDRFFLKTYQAVGALHLAARFSKQAGAAGCWNEHITSAANGQSLCITTWRQRRTRSRHAAGRYLRLQLLALLLH